MKTSITVRTWRWSISKKIWVHLHDKTLDAKETPKRYVIGDGVWRQTFDKATGREITGQGQRIYSSYRREVIIK